MVAKLVVRMLLARAASAGWLTACTLACLTLLAPTAGSRYIVVFKSDVSADAARAALASMPDDKAGYEAPAHSFFSFSDLHGFVYGVDEKQLDDVEMWRNVHVPEGASVHELVQADLDLPPVLQGLAGLRDLIDWVELDGTVRPAGALVQEQVGAAAQMSAAQMAGAANSEGGLASAPSSWNLNRISKRRLTEPGGRYLYDAATAGKGVDVYVVDSGIYTEHEDLAGRAVFGLDLTGEGDADTLGHGTHVAGTIGGTKYGVAKAVSIVAVRVLGASGTCAWSTVIQAISWVLDEAKRTGRPSVINMSLEGPPSPALDAAIASAMAAGVPVVVAAGNYAEDACKYSPGAAPQAITVAASDSLDLLVGGTAAPSNYGPCVDVLAPGGFILSAYIGGPAASAWFNGTSMAAPHVAGALAIHWSKDTGLDAGAVVRALYRRATHGALKDIQDGTPNRLLYSL